MEDTIVAIGTALGESAINIIKLSGQNAINIVNNHFKGKDLTKVASHTINYGHIVYKKEIIDEVLVSVFKVPKTYTKENVVEINCHGGIATTNKILEIMLSSGARLAEPGEFLKRAYLNGRVDLIEAESVQDLISSKTESARKMSLKGIDGTLSKLIKDLRSKILSIIANIEVNIDYPEYEDAVIITNKIMKKNIKEIEKKLQTILDQSKNGKIIKNGIKVGILGKPNVGKSSLLNLLINEKKAIVTDIEGTTRDIVEGTIILNGIEINFIDTAGIRETENYVEQIGVKKSYEILETADLLLVLLDNSKSLTKMDKEILKKTNKKDVIILLNKIDLESKIELDKLKKYKILNISVKENKGIEELKQAIISKFKLDKIANSDYTYLSNARQISLIKECMTIIKQIEKANNQQTDVDLIEIDLKRLWDKLGEITGETYKEELLDEIFSKFCLGK